MQEKCIEESTVHTKFIIKIILVENWQFLQTNFSVISGERYTSNLNSVSYMCVKVSRVKSIWQQKKTTVDQSKSTIRHSVISIKVKFIKKNLNSVS